MRLSRRACLLRISVPFATLLATGGCSSSHSSDDAGSATTDAGRRGDRAGDVWDGYVESYTFASGSDHVRIVLDSASGDGPRTGVVVFGDGAPPPPATDPDVGYPPGVDWGPLGGGFNVLRPSEGFEYPIVEASVAGARVQVTVSLGALWAGWCELQTSFPLDASGEAYACMPNTATISGESGCFIVDPATGEQVAVDCGKQALCGFGAMVCACDMLGCQAGDFGDVSFDFHVTGDAGDGTVEVGGPHNVHLTR